MVEPMTTFTAAAIAKLVYETVIKTGAETLTKGVIAKGKELWQKIRGKLKEEPAAEAALNEEEKSQSQSVLEQQVVPFLQVAMLKDPQFTIDLQSLAQQLSQEIQDNSQHNISINATSHDQSTLNAVGKISGGPVNFSTTNTPAPKKEPS